MANIVRIKRRAAGGAAGAPASLANAELAFNEQDSTLYYGVGTGGAGGTATSVLAIGGPGAVATLGGAQTITGAKTFSGANELGASTTATTQTAADNTTKVATTAFVKSQSYLTGNQTITASGDATGSGTVALALTLAASGVTAGTYPKVTVDAKGRVTVGAVLVATDIPTLTAAKISDFDTQVRLSRLDQLAIPTAPVALNAQRITGLAEPTAAQDAATKNYVDNVSAGLDPKASCRAATTANITLSAPQTIDGVAVIAGNRVLVKDQTTVSTNGIYVVAAGAWTRATDADVSAEVTSGMFTFIEEGTLNATSGWVLSTTGAVTLNTTALTFVQFSGAGSVSAGTGLTKTGNILSISTGYVGQSSITTLGTVGTGTWNATAISATYIDSAIARLASPALTGTPSAPTAAADTNTTQVATTAFVLGQSYASTAAANGTASAGSSVKWSRGDHVHPTDTTRAPLADPTFTGISAFPAAGIRLASGVIASPVAGDSGRMYYDGGSMYFVSATGVAVQLRASNVAALGAATITGGQFNGGIIGNTANVLSAFIDKVYLGAGTNGSGPLNFTKTGAVLTGAAIAGTVEVDSAGVLYYSPGTTRQRVAVTDGILTIATGKTLTANNTLTLSGTDASTLNIGAGGTLGTAAFTASTAYATAAQGTKADAVGAVSGLVKSNGSAAFSAAVDGTDYLSPNVTIDGGIF